MQVFVGKNGQKLGPFAEEIISEKIVSGEFAAADLCWKQGMPEWQPIREVFPQLCLAVPPTLPQQRLSSIVDNVDSPVSQATDHSTNADASDKANAIFERLSRAGLEHFLTIWTAPRKTIREIIDADPGRYVIPLACLSGVSYALERASSQNAGDSIPVSAIIGLACLFGPIVGVLIIWVGSYLIEFSGKWIGGIAKREDLRTAIAWSTVPIIAGLPLWVPLLLVMGSDVFTQEAPRLEAYPLLIAPFLAITLVQVSLAVWSFVLLCQTIAEAQGFISSWKGLGNQIVAFGMLFIVALVFVSIVSLLNLV